MDISALQSMPSNDVDKASDGRAARERNEPFDQSQNEFWRFGYLMTGERAEAANLLN